MVGRVSFDSWPSKSSRWRSSSVGGSPLSRPRSILGLGSCPSPRELPPRASSWGRASRPRREFDRRGCLRLATSPEHAAAPRAGSAALARTTRRSPGVPALPRTVPSPEQGIRSSPRGAARTGSAPGPDRERGCRAPWAASSSRRKCPRVSGHRLATPSQQWIIIHAWIIMANWRRPRQGPAGGAVAESVAGPRGPIGDRSAGTVPGISVESSGR